MFLFGYVYTHTSIDTMKNIPGSSFPWVGILRIHRNRMKAHGNVGIILITRAVAIGNAKEISKIDVHTITKSTKAEFLVMGTAFNYKIKDYIIHPEYYQGRVNTIAIVNIVDDERDAPKSVKEKHSEEAHVSEKSIFGGM
ncbi:uncharacterized protein LOC126377471 [Pectinophora gossypiella]|uniref:uncharacterized protein LOC126377471 n=1 Tax=Pectinophora gossypiella TaxID=13191 RepID=UPI00214F583C|nr:uncharacterized protein LOC126377471 [Pectinophora gossypiella]